MKAILAILLKAGGWHPGLYLQIDNPPHPQLVIDAMDESGPCALPALSVAQYVDALAAPEMCLELSFAGGVNLNPFYYRHDQRGLEEFSRCIANDHYVYDTALHRRHHLLADLWDHELWSQGVVDAFVVPQPLHG